MSYEIRKKVLSPEELKEILPLTDKQKETISQKRNELEKILDGSDDRLLLIIGPCSAHNEKAVADYMTEISKISKEVEDDILVVPRIYTGKPRTKGKGYKGPTSQPDPLKPINFNEGLKMMRRMYIDAIDKGMIPADEMLNPNNYPYVEDAIGYIAIGARSVENQMHREVASLVDVPVGMKNPTSGDLSVMMNALEAGIEAHTIMYQGNEVATSGNPLTHIILRGFNDDEGNHFPNYDKQTLHKIIRCHGKRDLENPVVVVDTNHSNSGKDYNLQEKIASSVMESRITLPGGSAIKGLMVESYLVDGAQKLGEGEYVYGQSVTDPCIGLEKTKKLVDLLSEKQKEYRMLKSL
ncbi:3-deoxy-7-phosphoheptulonate synthase [Candidatus Woesearchaeota archaeon]|nr:MAG: 3-deoxy-7-phosphoheptulonate synthase [Candidatus Woesearchaeota archaeon]